MEVVKPIYNFEVQENGDVLLFKYHKNMISYKAVVPLCLFTAILSLFICSALNPNSLRVGLFILVFFTVGLAFLGVYTINSIKTKTGEFIVKGRSVTVDSKTYDLDHVQHFRIKNSHEKSHESTTYYSRGSLFAVFDETSSHFIKYIIQTQFNIVARYATKEVLIASSLSEVDAEKYYLKTLLKESALQIKYK